MVINITCFKIPGSGFIFAASKYPSMTNKEIIQYTSVLFTQAPIRVCLDGTNIDSRTILELCITVVRLGYDLWLCMVINISIQYNGSGLLPDIILLTQGYYQWGTRSNTM